MVRNTIPSDMRFCEGQAVTLEAPVKSGTDTKGRRFQMVAYTGAAVDTLFGKMVLDVDGGQLGAKRKPILRNHDSAKIVGYSEEVDRKGHRVVLAGQVTDKTADGREVAELAADGFPWQASVGFTIQKAKAVAEGESLNVNGVTFTGPGIVISKWRLNEASFVPMGADDRTSGVVLEGTETDGLVEVEDLEVDGMKDDKSNADPVATFAAEHAGAVEKWKAEGLAAGVEQEHVRFGALHKEFPDRPAFVCEQFGKGNDVPAAKAALADVLLAEGKASAERLADLERQNAELTRKVEASSDGHPGVGFTGESATPVDESKLSVHELAEQHWRAKHSDCDGFAGVDDYRRCLAEEFRLADEERRKAQRRTATRGT